MARYRKKPVVIEAFQLGIDYIPDWFMDKVTTNEIILHGTSSGFDHHDDTNADIKTLEGWHHASFGDFIIKGVKGEVYPCKPDIFKMTYDPADTTADVAPRAEVAREIFEEIEETLNRKIRRIEPEYERLDECFEKLSECGHSQHGYCKGVISTCEDLQDLIDELKKKYTEVQK